MGASFIGFEKIESRFYRDVTIYSKNYVKYIALKAIAMFATVLSWITVTMGVFGLLISAHSILLFAPSTVLIFGIAMVCVYEICVITHNILMHRDPLLLNIHLSPLAKVVLMFNKLRDRIEECSTNNKMLEKGDDRLVDRILLFLEEVDLPISEKENIRKDLEDLRANIQDKALFAANKEEFFTQLRNLLKTASEDLNLLVRE